MSPWLHGLVLGVPLIAALIAAGAWATWYERRFAGRLHNRHGPRWVGPWGLLQPVADGLKMLQKEDLTPRSADRALFHLAPILPLGLVLATAAVLPLGGGWLEDGSWESRYAVAELDIGVLWVLALAGLVMFPLWTAGWASNNKWSLLAGMRVVAQGVSYEIPLVLAALVPVVATGSLSLSEIVAWQAEHGWLVWRLPGVGLLAFALFFVCSLAESDRIPFDIPEAESELIAGVAVEYTGMKMGLFVFSEYVHTIVSAALAAVLFLGGAHGPAPHVLGPVWLALKTFALFAIVYWIRWSWFRLRADQLMHLCWTWLVPGGLVLVVAAAALAVGGWA